MPEIQFLIDKAQDGVSFKVYTVISHGRQERPLKRTIDWEAKFKGRSLLYKRPNGKAASVGADAPDVYIFQNYWLAYAFLMRVRRK